MVLYETKLLQTATNKETFNCSPGTKAVFYFEKCEMFTEADSAEASLRREQMKMDARRVKLKVSAGFKMRGLILRPYVRLG